MLIYDNSGIKQNQVDLEGEEILTHLTNALQEEKWVYVDGILCRDQESLNKVSIDEESYIVISSPILGG